MKEKILIFVLFWIPAFAGMTMSQGIVKIYDESGINESYEITDNNFVWTFTMQSGDLIPGGEIIYEIKNVETGHLDGWLEDIINPVGLWSRESLEPGKYKIYIFTSDTKYLGESKEFVVK